jgi:hypothetical protein
MFNSLGSLEGVSKCDFVLGKLNYSEDKSYDRRKSMRGKDSL